MRRREALPALLFRAVCLSFSALLLTLSLFRQLRAVSLETEIAEGEACLAALREERNRLEIARAESVRLEELEDYAIRVLGMQRPTPGQIVTTGIKLRAAE